jgi:hypothetical protein
MRSAERGSVSRFPTRMHARTGFAPPLPRLPPSVRDILTTCAPRTSLCPSAIATAHLTPRCLPGPPGRYDEGPPRRSGCLAPLDEEGARCPTPLTMESVFGTRSTDAGRHFCSTSASPAGWRIGETPDTRPPCANPTASFCSIRGGRDAAMAPMTRRRIQRITASATSWP